MSMSDKAKNRAANAIIAVQASLHSGDPGADGAANELPTAGGIYSRKATNYGAAVAGKRSLPADILFDIPPASSVSHFVIWDEAGDVVKIGQFAKTETYSGQGQHKIKAVGSELTVNG
jgi:hypothetical protein